jgi:hypothetical protein
MSKQVHGDYIRRLVDIKIYCEETTPLYGKTWEKI